MTDTPAPEAAPVPTAPGWLIPPAQVYGPIARAVTRDKRIVEFTQVEAGGLIITIEGHRNALELDPFQAAALRAALAAQVPA
ncbi:hypothetical protein [Roseococcus microcysteis]|uniref:hypothetical protein n=1 Tax=Roseococcus microcysteis TaxID=2771361 RepID=UPI00168BBE04|nr:hypothetical protein [Roseococcus microcysteis]